MVMQTLQHPLTGVLHCISSGGIGF